MGGGGVVGDIARVFASPYTAAAPAAAEFLNPKSHLDRAKNMVNYAQKGNFWAAGQEGANAGLDLPGGIGKPFQKAHNWGVDQITALNPKEKEFQAKQLELARNARQEQLIAENKNSLSTEAEKKRINQGISEARRRQRALSGGGTGRSSTILTSQLGVTGGDSGASKTLLGS